MLKILREITDADLREKAQNSRMQEEATAQFKIPPDIWRRLKKCSPIRNQQNVFP